MEISVYVVHTHNKGTMDRDFHTPHIRIKKLEMVQGNFYVLNAYKQSWYM